MTTYSATVPLEAKHLRACLDCKLIMSDVQWQVNESQCPNCKKLNPVVTTRFVGMVGHLMPQESWVTRFNEESKGSIRLPGIYAMHVLDDEDMMREDEEPDDAELSYD